MKIKAQNYNKGKVGEKMALDYLVDKGFRLIEQNFSIDTGKKGEIDLIMSDQDWLVFVEVKYKSDDRLGRPEEMIDRKKLAQVKRIAEVYLMKNPEMRKRFIKYRIDAVCILGSDIRHYDNVYA